MSIIASVLPRQLFSYFVYNDAFNITHVYNVKLALNYAWRYCTLIFSRLYVEFTFAYLLAIMIIFQTDLQNNMFKATALVKLVALDHGGWTLEPR